MRIPLPPSSLPLGLALLWLAGCQTTKSAGPAPTPPPPETPAVPAPAEAPSWQRARLGDAATYTFSAKQGAGRMAGATGERALSGQVTLEVVGVQQPWVWLRVSFADDAGQPLAQTRLAQPMLLPMRTDATRDVKPEGEAVAERATAAGRTWEARRYEKDSRPVDGPLVTRVYANAPGPLYLTRGLLSARTESAGFRVPGGSELTLKDVREGSATAGAPPALERPFGPGTWYDRRLEQGPTPQLTRVCFGAESGYLLRAEGPIDTNAAPCASFAQAEPEPLEEALLGRIWEATTQDWPPAEVAKGAAKDTFRAEGREVPALTAKRTEKQEGVERVFTQTYAAEPWGAALSGLAYEARFQTLSDTAERVEKGGKRVGEGGSRLVRWGAWWNGGK